MDMSAAMRVFAAWNTFKSNHPKFPAFCKAVGQRGLREDSVIEVIVTTPEGEKIETSLKLQAGDLELLRSFGTML
ncbi:MAG: hypothetical protein IJ747_02760 [Lachnospiraceae bacterium]|nr:hypothetical protein [Lachnospiraceae bacterium]